MMIRDFVYEITGDKKMSYDHPKVRGLRLDTKTTGSSWLSQEMDRLVTHKNFDKFDWSTYTLLISR